MSATRRSLIAATGAAALAAIPSARAQEQAPAIRWRMVTSYPKSLDILHGMCTLIARRVGELTNGQFQISVHAAGEIVPPLAVLDSVSNNTVECGHTAAYYYIGKNASLAFDTTIPFGLNARSHFAWMHQGGGLALLRDLYKGFNIINFPAGNTGAQMGGWFRAPVKSLQDVKGLRMRIPGWGGRIFAELGVVPQSIAGGDIYPALERGTIDASEWVGPYDDEKLGLYKVAKFYHYPGWWEPCGQLTFYVNNGEWAKLPKAYQSAIETASAEAYADSLATYDARNPAALRRLLSAGVKLQRFPNDVIDAAIKKTDELLEAEAAKDPVFKALLTSYREFANLQTAWQNIGELAMETANRRRKPT